MSRHINAAGLDLIKSFEGLRLTAYPDPQSGEAPWTIGYGHAGHVLEGDVITEQQADAFLAADLAVFEAGVSSSATVPLTDNQFAALVSFSFNLGLGRLRGSTLLRRLNNGDYDGAAGEFPKWTSGGLPGLVRRRAAERDLFLRPDETDMEV
ncbi:lysozyme [Telmatospirillum siberiense]|uniref:Lysozyme n=1 Tax=Telmatospirillum siberiense TaxID=382514 RepID=A0A2N3PRY9_9PROT|nr:lysozyme [Telmatospirillum siberiense]PKU23162.1 muraminidase [Telmatospirillum siberiense]